MHASNLDSGKTEAQFVRYGLGIFSPFVAICMTTLIPNIWTLAYKASLDKTMQVLLYIAICT